VNLFKAFKKKPVAKSEPVIHRNFPEVNAFVHVTVDESEEVLPIESIGGSSFTVRSPKIARVGDRALFAYSSGTCKFQFDAVCTQIHERSATFVKPKDITLVGKFIDRRAAIRIKCALAVLFRTAPDGVGSGEFIETSVGDISIAGTSMLLPCEPNEDEYVEIRFDLKGQGDPFTTIASIVRPGEEQPSGKFLAGLTFESLGARESKAIDNFMVVHQHEIRERNLALDDQ
jgi:hypothetical protein